MSAKTYKPEEICDQCVDHGSDFLFCTECGQEIDGYGNTEGAFRNCCYPDCGCDGSRLCMAPNGPNWGSAILNIEGQYRGCKQ